LDRSSIARNGSLKASVTVSNTGNRDGVEIVQLYIHDVVASAEQPVKKLEDFQRVPLKVGESKTIEFTVTSDKLAIYDADMKYGVEPGDFEVMVGGSSRDADLLKTVFTVE
jgi:beta-glucosidase